MKYTKQTFPLSNPYGHSKIKNAIAINKVNKISLCQQLQYIVTLLILPDVYMNFDCISSRLFNVIISRVRDQQRMNDDDSWVTV